jgi:phenylalanyl-tRNA synthetase beta chain
MRISLSWLQRYIDIPYKPEDLAQRLTMVGLEVESIERLGEKYNKFFVGEVLEVTKHPNADKLTVCKVNLGDSVQQIVCGAPNVAAGLKVAVGLAGAIVPHNQHDPAGKPFQLSSVTLRGVESQGMICSAYELDRGDEKNGILILDAKAKVGTPLAKYFGLDDVVFEIGITPNRPDCLCHIGIAREIAAFSGKKLVLPTFRVKESKRHISKFASVRIVDKVNCPRYTARVLIGAENGSSPQWMQDLLTAVGLRPVNTIVDITNFVLMEYGHPLHAFDYDKLDEHAIVVRCAKEGEKFVTLDHKERALRSDTLMICDTTKPVAIAGVMGGLTSEISDTTKNVLLESAYFKPQSIRRTSKTVGLSTDASQRFERGADPNATRWAADRAIALMQELCGGEVLRGVIDVYPKKIVPSVLSLRVKKTNEVLGTNLTEKKIITFLKKLNITAVRSTKQDGGTIQFKVPTNRPDLEREIDLIEEVARLFGYDNIETKTRSFISFGEQPPQTELSDEIRHWLIGRGFHEVVANSMQDVSSASLVHQNVVRVANPISKDMEALRTTLVVGMLQIIRHNLFHGSKNLRLFELGRVYSQNPALKGRTWNNGIIEEKRLIMALSGQNEPLGWDKQPRSTDFFDLKGEMEGLFKKIFLDKFKFIPYSNTRTLTQSGLDIEINGVVRGFAGKVKDELLKRFEIEQDVFVLELTIDDIDAAIYHEKKYCALPKYPSVTRDLALVVDDAVPVESLMQTVKEVGGQLVKSVELFDIYRGNQIAKGRKSCAIALEFRSEEKTLEQGEVDAIVENILRHVTSKFQATVRM